MSTENNSTAVAEEIPNLLITPTAQEYLKDLLDKQNTPGIGVRVFVENPGTPRAECCMAYSAPEEVVPTDYKQDYPDFPAFVDAPSIPYLLLLMCFSLKLTRALQGMAATAHWLKWLKMPSMD